MIAMATERTAGYVNIDYHDIGLKACHCDLPGGTVQSCYVSFSSHLIKLFLFKYQKNKWNGDKKKI